MADTENETGNPPDETEGKQTDERKIAHWKAKVSKVRNWRQMYERQWLVNVAFLYGKHHFTLDKKSGDSLEDQILWEFKDIQRKKKLTRSSNYLLVLYRSVLARFLMMKSSVDVDASTGSDNDKSCARVAKLALDDFWQNVNKKNPMLCKHLSGMQMVLMRTFGYFLCTGQGYLVPDYNPDALGKAVLTQDGKQSVVNDMKIGEIEVKVFHNFDVFRDFDRRWFVTRERESIEQIEEKWDVKVEPETDISDTAEQQLLNLLDGGTTRLLDTSAVIYTVYQLPNKKHPNGRKLKYVSDKVLLDEDLPTWCKGRLPVFELDYLNFGFSDFAQGMIEQLVSLQEDYNYTIKRITEYKKWFAGKMMVSRGAKLSSKPNDDLNQILFYNQGHKPEQVPGCEPPEYLWKELERIRKDMQDISAAHDPSLGSLPHPDTSGIAIENMTELDNSMLSPELISTEKQLSFFCEMVIDCMEENYNVPRFISVAGSDMAAEVASFVGSGLNGNKEIQVSMGSSMPATKSARQDFLVNMFKLGLIDQPKLKELLEFGNIGGAFNDLDEAAAKRENQLMSNPAYVIKAEPWENQTTHLNTHHDFMKTEDFYNSPPDIQQKYISHCSQHQQFLLQETQAAGKMAPPPGGASKPPAGPSMPPPAPAVSVGMPQAGPVSA